MPLSETASQFEKTDGDRINAKFGPSGLLKNEIAAGAHADIFASANMMHAQALHEAGKAEPVTCFARNTLCALVKAGLNVSSENLLERMLDLHIKLGTSTPQADPSGDYAFAMFRKAESLRPGAQAALESKALMLTGGQQSAAAPAGRNLYGWHVAEGRADIFLTYRTNALVAQAQNPGQQCVRLPDALAIGADYGLTVVKGAPVGARAFSHYIVSTCGQMILARYGFAPPAQ
jgi:molybdenum ABC transporter molybdate-binding protein